MQHILLSLKILSWVGCWFSCEEMSEEISVFEKRKELVRLGRWQVNDEETREAIVDDTL